MVGSTELNMETEPMKELQLDNSYIWDLVTNSNGPSLDGSSLTTENIFENTKGKKCKLL